MSAPKSDLLPGTLDMLILQTVAPKPMHGYAIARTIRTVSDDALEVEQGSLYPALYRMERRGWIKAKWGVTETKRRAKFYQITAAGRRHLEQEQSTWAAFVEAVARVMGKA
jgi:PadR family transcriptional regulator PadR